MARKVRRSPVSRDKRFKQRSTSDFGTNERWQHSGRTLEYTETAGVFAVRASEEHILDKLVLMKVVDMVARDAGLKLHHDYHMARIESRVTASYSSVRSSAGDAESRLLRNVLEEAAYQRWRNALRAVSPMMRDMVIHVSCIGHAPSMMQLIGLRDGLSQLARYYGLTR
ncbi:MAG: hypothetical protein K2Q32_00925 [Alphaproteobacteria bacterium]|nr:hypothetical protein [Alphaproteobacteria bacterium]